MRRLLALLIGLLVCCGAFGAAEEALKALAPQDLETQRLEGVRPGDRIRVRMGNELVSYVARVAQSDSHGGGVIEGHLLTSPARSFRVEWSPSGAIGLFQGASGAFAAMGLGGGASLVVEAPGASTPTAATHAAAEVAAEHSARMRESYSSAAGHFFQSALLALAPIVGQAFNDRAVAYQARCGKPVTLGAIRSFFQTTSEEGVRVIGLLTAAQQDEASCHDAVAGACERFAALRGDYLTAVTRVTCEEALADSQ